MSDGKKSIPATKYSSSERLGHDISQLRPDWARYYGTRMEKHGDRWDGRGVLDLIAFESHREEDQDWPHGISRSIPRLSERYLVAKRFVVTQAALRDCLSPHSGRGKKMMPKLLLPSKMGVLGVTVPGPGAPRLRTGLALVTTAEGRTLFVLSDTGRVVGNEDDGIDWKCRDLLSCDQHGHRI